MPRFLFIIVACLCFATEAASQRISVRVHGARPNAGGPSTPTFTTDASLDQGTEDVDCGTNDLDVTGGVGTIEFTVISGSFPVGCTLNSSTGVLEGAATTAGTYIFTAEAEDDNAAVTTREFTLSIASGGSSPCSDGGDAVFACIRDKNGVVSGGQPIDTRSFDLKSNASITAFANDAGEPDADWGVYYFPGSGMTDDYPNPPANMSRVIMPALDAGISSATAPEHLLNISTGAMLVYWQSWTTNEMRMAVNACTANGRQETQKTFQFKNNNGSGPSTSTIWAEMRHQFDGKDVTDFSGDAPGFSGVKQFPVSAITATGGTASATYSGTPALTNGQVVSVSGSTTEVPIPVTSCAAGTNPVCTTTSPHGLLIGGVIDIEFDGETPNVFSGAPKNIFQATVTGASTVTLGHTVRTITIPSGGTTGGSIRVTPYSARNVVATVTDSTHFTYPIVYQGTPASAVADSNGMWVTGDPDVNFTGTDCWSLNLRTYGGVLDSRTPALGSTNFIAKCKELVSYWFVLQIDSGAAWTCGAVSGFYDLVNIYVGGETRSIVRVYNDLNIELDFLRGNNGGANPVRVTQTAQCATFTDITRDQSAVAQAYLEFNTSAGDCENGFGTNAYVYVNNWVMAHSPLKNGVIVPGATTLTVDGTNILFQP